MNGANLISSAVLLSTSHFLTCKDIRLSVCSILVLLVKIFFISIFILYTYVSTGTGRVVCIMESALSFTVHVSLY